jgi:hypothetical protein
MVTAKISAGFVINRPEGALSTHIRIWKKTTQNVLRHPSAHLLAARLHLLTHLRHQATLHRLEAVLIFSTRESFLHGACKLRCCDILARIPRQLHLMMTRGCAYQSSVIYLYRYICICMYMYVYVTYIYICIYMFVYVYAYV